MKLTVDQDLCIACGACIDICPEVFDWNDEGYHKLLLMKSQKIKRRMCKGRT